MSNFDIAQRQKNLRARMAAEQVEAFIATSVANVSYLTGFKGDDSWAIATKKIVYLLTDSRFTEQAQKECQNTEIIERKEGLAKTARVILEKQKNIKAVGIEDSTSLAMFGAVNKEIKAKVRKTSGVCEGLRQIKDSSEVLEIKRAAKIAQEAIDETLGVIKAGMSEGEAAGILNLNMRKRGWRESFETIVAFGPNASRPHHLSSSRKLKENDTILIDWGAKVGLYCSDLTRCFAVGKLNAFYERVYNAVLEAQQAAIAIIKAGVSAAEVDEAARKVIRKHKLPEYGHGTGHGLGLEVHEGPSVSWRNKEALKAGAVITIEPGVYIPGKLGVRIEDDVLVTEKGCQILSEQAGGLIVLNQKGCST